MKSLIIGTAALTLMASVSMAVPVYTFTTTELASLVKVWDKPVGNSGPLSINTGGAYDDNATATTLAVGYETQLSSPSADPYYPWATIALGFPLAPAGPDGQSAPQGDLTGFTEYALTFANDDDDAWMVNLYMYTGWVGIGESNTFSQNGWVMILPGASATVAMDFATDGPNGGAIPFLNHVSNIGFQIGATMDSVNPNPSTNDAFHISVSPIPEPATLMILGLGSLGLLRLRKKS